ncbi:Ferroporti-1 [Paraphoma chrysanthemicola]|nr:Ferroporti-1 [Paraphoma chrysanthemicola]
MTSPSRRSLSTESARSSSPMESSSDPTTSGPKATRPVLWRLYASHTLSTWNARTFEFGAVIFLAQIFPGTLFFASCYALFRSAAAAVLGSWIGSLVDRRDRLWVVTHSIIWQRCSVAGSCLVLGAMLPLASRAERGVLTYIAFLAAVVLACVEKLAFVANTVAVERDWIIVVADSLGVERQELNSTMRRIDLLCKLIAPLGIGLLDGYSTKVAIWFVFGQNAISVLVEYFAIVQVHASVPELAKASQSPQPSQTQPHTTTPQDTRSSLTTALHQWKDYLHNPAFLASFALSLLYLTVLSFASQMTTYLLTLGFTSTHVSLMRLVSVILELSATCAAPWLMSRIGAVRSGLWFINEQLISIALAIGVWLMYTNHPLFAGATLVSGVALSRLGLWGFDLSVQFLVQAHVSESSRGSFSAIEMSVQNMFELLSFATTMVFYRPEDFRIAVLISGAAVAVSAACFAGYVRRERGHLVHVDRCLKRMGRGGKKIGYRVLPTIEEEVEMDEGAAASAQMR